MKSRGIALCTMLITCSVISISGFAREIAAPVSVKLFDAKNAFISTSDNRTVAFNSVSVPLSFQPGVTAVISSTPDGNSPIVIDNYMPINGQTNICLNVPGALYNNSCFGEFKINPRLGAKKNLPIENVLTPIPPVDVTQALQNLPFGTNNVTFALNDSGEIGGNTELWLVVFAASAEPPVSVDPISPPGPALEVVVTCLGKNPGEAPTAAVVNKGLAASDPTTLTINIDRVSQSSKVAAEGTHSNRNQPVPSIDPRKSEAIFDLDFFDLQQCPKMEPYEYCSVLIRLEKWPPDPLGGYVLCPG